MQITKVSAYSLKMVLKQNAKGIRVTGYTVKPGFSNGLFMGAAPAQQVRPFSYVGF